MNIQPRSLPSSNEELYADSVREVEYRLRRLEAQRADAPQRTGTIDTTEYAWVQSLGGWFGGVAPPTLTVNIEVPSDEAYVILAWGVQVANQNAAVPHRSAVFGTLTHVLSVDGVPRQSQTHGTLSTTGRDYTVNTQAAVGAVTPVYPLRLAAGAHAITLGVTGTPNAGHASGTLWTMNRYVRVFVHG